MTLKIAATLVYVLLSLATFGQTDHKLLTKEQALEDLKILETSLREIHPNIYRYTSKTEFDTAYKKVRQAIGDSVSVKQFNNLVIPIITMIHCGHTFSFTSLVDEKKGLLPLDVKILNDKLFVIRNLSANKKLLVGSEIMAINGISAVNLLNDLRRKQNADGYGTNFKDRIIERSLRWKFATFINQPDSFELEVKEYRTEQQKRLTIAAQSTESIDQEIKKSAMISERPLYFSVDVENNVAILKLGSFMAKNLKKQNGQNLRKTIKRSFKQLHGSKVDNLIIDIRGNTGGKVFATPLVFSYLTDENFKVEERILFKHGYNFSYPQYLNRNKFNDWFNSKLDKKVNDSTYEWHLHKITRKTFREKRNRYKGRVYVLINGMTASAGAELASIISAHNKAIFVGEETGGDFNGVNGFDRTYLHLPHSDIGVLIAGWRGIMAWKQNENIGHGVVPTYEVHPTIDDLLLGKDTEMKFIFQMIKNKQ
jgi:hypothetical protein